MQMDRFEALTLALMADKKEWTSRDVADALKIDVTTAKCGLDVLCDVGKVRNVSLHTRQKPQKFVIA